ncbi:MAG: glutamate cyclase domain-containing protein, partial [Dehalococcoidia bacterium]
MWGTDITPYTARLDYLFLHDDGTVAVGDGGNEIGMGNLAQHIPSVPGLPKEPAATTVAHLIIASVSNWGAYGLVAALSLLRGANLLPSVAEEEEVIRWIVELGAVDGMKRRRELSVDGFPLSENAATLARLHALLAAQGVGA